VDHGLAAQLPEPRRRIFAQHILETKPNAKIAILYQNDDYGKRLPEGLRGRPGRQGQGMIVSKVTYEVTDPTIDSQMVTLKGTGADVFFNITTPKFAAQAIKKAAEIGWKPTHYLNNVSASVGSVLTPAGLDNSKGIITAQYIKDPTDPQFQKGKEWDDYVAWLKKYNANADLARTSTTSTATPWRRAWCRCSSRPATT
jgi:branched-chain amino acid transport system substrate-binding protein